MNITRKQTFDMYEQLFNLYAKRFDAKFEEKPELIIGGLEEHTLLANTSLNNQQFYSLDLIKFVSEMNFARIHAVYFIDKNKVFLSEKILELNDECLIAYDLGHELGHALQKINGYKKQKQKNRIHEQSKKNNHAVNLNSLNAMEHTISEGGADYLSCEVMLCESNNASWMQYAKDIIQERKEFIEENNQNFLLKLEEMDARASKNFGLKLFSKFNEMDYQILLIAGHNFFLNRQERGLPLELFFEHPPYKFSDLLK